MPAYADTPGDVVVISGSRVERSSFDLAAAIDVVDDTRTGEAQMRVNLSEALVSVPGLVVSNRQNYAQDLQISSRGFGARSAFGVRGMRLISDGIPATMPDGQGQAATFNLDVASRIEVLRGPLAAIYGNHSGGVMQLLTKTGEGPASVELNLLSGSDGVGKIDVNAQGESAGIAYVVDSSRFQTSGYRQHSAAKREANFAKIALVPWEKSKLTLVANRLVQADTQDPLGVQWLTFLNNPRQAEIDSSDTQNPKRSFAERYNTRKSINHVQFGLTYEQLMDSGRLRLSLYDGDRQVSQYQAFSKAFQATASQSGGVVDFDRHFYGAEVNWLTTTELAGGVLTTTLGLDYARSSDKRQGFENFILAQYGVKGNLRRDEQDIVTSLDPYLQTEWVAGPWRFSAGLRRNQLDIRVYDYFLANGNDSGSLSYAKTTQFAGLLYKWNPDLNLYASAARGMESPTLNELFYSGSGSGFNFNLRAAQNTQMEAGAKVVLPGGARLNAAIFQVRSTDELVVDTAVGGRTSYWNAARTLRQGVEVALDWSWHNGVSARFSGTALRAIYDQAYGAIAAGNRLPGVPNTNWYGELAWHAQDERFNVGLEMLGSGKLYVEDSNKETAAPAYAIANFRIGARQDAGAWRFKEFLRVNNLSDKTYVGSVIVADTNRRFYEAALGRNWLLGASIQMTFY
ncbi:TonB-dependent receptor family protein [Undibacterium sp. Ji50W]|uniref:TonB-dependent receptor family protein n=1 Tax=Undibacterium sp. Ji50W TaxID=3413041 RepID=UPI003BF40E03